MHLSNGSYMNNSRYETDSSSMIYSFVCAWRSIPWCWRVLAAVPAPMGVSCPALSWAPQAREADTAVQGGPRSPWDTDHNFLV